jgi:hypothetical protein
MSTVDMDFDSGSSGVFVIELGGRLSISIMSIIVSIF